jgi:hypothetical protein
MREIPPTETDTPLQAALREIDLDRSGASFETLLAVTELAIEIAREGREGSYNQKLWMRDLLKGATYPPS